MTVLRRIMEKFRIGEISGVDKPAQAHARTTIMKRDFDDSAYETLCKRTFTAAERRESEAKGHAMPGGRYPIENGEDLENAIHAVGRGKGSHAAIRAHIESRAKALGMTDKIPDTWKSVAKKLTVWHDNEGNCTIQHDAEDDDDGVSKACAAFAKCVEEIHKDASISDKASEVAKQRADFVKHLVAQEFDAASVEKAADELSAIVAGSAGASGYRIVKGDTMSLDALKKALGLSADASEADVTKAAEKMAEDKKKAEKEKDRAEKFAKMSEKHKAYMDHPEAKMPDGGKDAFKDMEPGERDKHIEAHPIEDDDEETEKALKKGLAFKAPNGTILRKRDFGTEAGFEFAKAQAAELATAKATLAKREEESTVASFEKRATGLGFPAAFGATLRKAYSGDAAAQALVEKEMTALRKQAEAGGVFSELGKRGGTHGTAYAELTAKAEELRKSQPTLKQAAAFAKVYEDPANREIVKRYNEERAAAN